MRVGLLLFTITFIDINMPLIKTVLKHIQDSEPNVNRREALVKTLLLVPKLANNFERISFLVQCRKAHILPRFIQDIMAKTSIISSRDNFNCKKRRFSRELLNEAIQESFRKQAFLQREKKRLEEMGTQVRPDLWSWLQDQCRSIFARCREENRKRLVKKFDRLLNSKRMQTNSSGRSETTEEREVREVREEQEKEQDMPPVPHPGINQETSRDEEEDTNLLLTGTGGPHDQESFKNLSKLQLDASLTDLLGRGPKFALTRKVTTNVLKEVESGIERSVYALRWKVNIENRRQQQLQQIHQEQQQQHRYQQNEENEELQHQRQQHQHHEREQQQRRLQQEEQHQPQRHDRTAATSADGEQRPDQEQTSRGTRLLARFPDGDCSQAPLGCKEMEEALQKVKKKITAAYKGLSKSTHNHTSAQRNALKQLAGNKEVVVKPSDKCKGLVLLNASDYVSKIGITTSGYQVVPRNPTPKLEATTKRIIHDTMDGKVEDRVIKAIIPHCSRTAELYGIPKDHKPDIPLRPIVSACDDPVDKLTWLLEKVVTQLLPYVPAHLKNTAQFFETLSAQYPMGFEEGTILFSVDVVNLYGNIPITEAIDGAMNLLDHHKETVETFGLDSASIRKLLEHCLTNNFVRFGQEYFRQTQGIAMGSRVAPPLAIVFMHTLESLFLAAPRLQPSLYVRYIDDVFGVWTHGRAALIEYFNFLNTVHPTIKFTLEHTGDTGVLAFLDTKISVSESGAYSSELYIKPMASPVIIHYRSALPMSTKKNTVRSQMLRAIRVSSPGLPRARSLKTIEDLFLKNGYPPHFVNKLKKEVLHQRSSRPSRPSRSDAPPVYLVLPFVDDTLCRRVEGIVKASHLNVRVAWRGGPSLKQKLVRSAYCPTPCPGGGRQCHSCKAGLRGKCHTKNVVYRMDCGLCRNDEAFYIGETRRSVRLRYNEHIRDASNNKADTPFGLHQARHPGIPLNSSNISIKILHVCKDGPDRKIWESIYIRDLKPTLNTQTSSWPIL